MAGGAYPSSQFGRLQLQAASGQPHWMEPLALFGGANTGQPLTALCGELIVRAGALVAELSEVAQELDARYVCIFGSVAAGTDDAHSDVDVLVVGALSAVDAQVAFKAMSRKHGRKINAVAIQPVELPGKLAQGGAFWTSVAQGKRIDLNGAWADVALR